VSIANNPRAKALFELHTGDHIVLQLPGRTRVVFRQSSQAESPQVKANQASQTFSTRFVEQHAAVLVFRELLSFVVAVLYKECRLGSSVTLAKCLASSSQPVNTSIHCGVAHLGERYGLDATCYIISAESWK